ncbi:MAG: protein kinase [Candidatus Promineifilaceae bacterium]
MNDRMLIGGRYQTIALIAQGMMGPVYRGLDQQSNQPVAIKVLKPDILDQHPTLLARFLREGDALRQLNHPNIVRWMNVIEHDGVHYLIMDFIGGGSLHDLLGKQPQLPVFRVLEIGVDLSDALARAHRLGIIHRDLKPQNVLLSEDGTPHLSDFGVAHYVDRTTISKPGGFAGTLAYIPPESFQGQEAGEQADVWSFGVMLYEMLAGRLPFESRSMAGQIGAILNEPLPSLVNVRPDLPDDLVRLIELMLVKDWEVRIQSIRLVGAALEAIKKGQPAELPGVAKQPLGGRLPDRPTPFIGRERELAEVIAFLKKPRTRLLTLTGPGGVGKTRLALQVARALRSHYGISIFFVDLAPVSSPDLVAGRIARAIGLKEGPSRSPVESIKVHLRDRKCLLLLDNFEQIIAAAPDVGELIAAIPGLDVLVTSREILNLYGEQEYPVPPLEIPDQDDQTADLSEYESVALFVRHAQLSNPNFRLTENNVRDVADICIQLDGLPLAIELAAARSKAYPISYLLSLLDNSLEALSGGSRDLATRHQTLQATISWSYDLLDAQEKKLFSRMAVFHGGRSLDAIQVVCQPGLDITIQDDVVSLINKSLLQRTDDLVGMPRYYFLETIHKFALERLLASDDAEAMQRRHAVFFAELTEQSEPELRGPDQERWSARLRVEYDNLRAALSWALGGEDPELGLRLVGALAEFWYYEGPISEGEKWIMRALDLLKSEQVLPGIRAKVLNGAGMLAFVKGDHTNGERWNQQALEIARNTRDQVSQAWALFWLSAHATVQPESYHEGIALIEEALSLFRDSGDQAGLAWGYNQLGELNRLVGDLKKAKVAYEASLVICRDTGNKRREAIALINMSYVAQGQGDYPQAIKHCLAGLALLHELKLEYHSAIALSVLAGPLASQEHATQATTVLGASEVIFQRMAVTLQPADRVEIESYIDQTRQLLDEKAFDAAWHRGWSMTTDQALAYALSLAEDL